MKKIFVLVLVFLFVIMHSVLATTMDVKGYLEDLKEYESDFFPELENQSFVDSLMLGKVEIEKETLLERILNLFTKEIKNSLQIMLKLLSICVFCALVKHMQQNHESSVSEVAFYVCYILICTILLQEFMEIVKYCQNALRRINSFSGVVHPMMITYLAVSGNMTVSTILAPTLFWMITLFSQVSDLFVFPFVLICTVLGLVSYIAETVDVSKISKVLKKTLLVVMEIVLVIFIGVLSLEGSLAANVDSVIAKTSKAIMSSTIPVVGKIMRRCGG